MTKGWRIPMIGPAGSFRHMACSCGAEAWLKKERGKKPSLFNFRADPSLPFVTMKQVQGDDE